MPDDLGSAAKRKPGRPRIRAYPLPEPRYSRTPIQIGERHGKLVALARDSSGTTKRPRYKVRCDCGSEYVIGGNTFRTAMSCAPCAPKKQSKYKNGKDCYSPLYRTWVGMRRRCRDLDTPRGAHYAQRGISVCAEWDHSFEAFETWAAENNYEPGLSIDRIDSDGDYCPENCEWVTRSVNSKRARAAYQSVRRKRSSWDVVPIEALWGVC